MSKHWMPIYIGDFLADTARLTTEEIGGYVLLIFYYWKNGGPIPYDENELLRVTRFKGRNAKQRLNNVVAYFRNENGLLHHKRIDAELVKATDFSRIQSDKAKKRWPKPDPQPRQQNATALRRQSHGNAMGMPTTVTLNTNTANESDSSDPQHQSTEPLIPSDAAYYDRKRDEQLAKLATMQQNGEGAA